MDSFVAKLRSRQALSPADEALLRSAAWTTSNCQRHDVIVGAGEPLKDMHLLLGGFAARVHEDASGEGQIVGLAVAGDMLDIHGLALGRVDQAVIALSPCEIATIGHREIAALARKSEAIRTFLALQAGIEHSVQSAWIHALGTKRGTAKIAHLMCEMELRLGLVGIATDKGFPLPLSQQELADYSGMTNVHLNRCLRELRDADLVSLTQGWVHVHDRAALQRLARFDDTYLNLRQITA